MDLPFKFARKQFHVKSGFAVREIGYKNGFGTNWNTFSTKSSQMYVVFSRVQEKVNVVVLAERNGSSRIIEN